MDTKWKNFDKLTIIRLVCVVLSVVFAFVGSVKALGFWIYLEQNNAYSEAAAAVEEFFGGNGEELYKSKIYDEYQTFLGKALDKGLFYVSGDSKGYENYKKKSLDKYCDDLIDVLCKSTVFGTDYFVFYSLDEGYISLKKIGNFPLTIDSTFYYERKAGYRIFAHSPNDCNYKFETDNFYNTGDDENTVTTFAPTEPQVSAAQKESESSGIADGLYRSALFSYYDYSDAWHEREQTASCALSSGGAKYHPDIVSDNMKAVKASKADAVIMIESAYMGDKYYSGTYEITLNRDVIAESGFEAFVNDGEGIISEDEYLEMYKNINDSLSKYKNAYFAVLDESTGRFTANVTAKDKKVTTENVERLIKDTCGKNSYVFFSGRAKGWENDFERLVCNTGTSFENRVSSDTVFTVWAGFDESLSGGIDPFSHTESAKETSDMLGDTFPPVLVCLLGWLICIIALAFMTGRKSYDDEIHLHRLDSIFTLLRTAINFGLIVLAFYGGCELLFSHGYHYDYETGFSSPIVTRGGQAAFLIICVVSLFILADWILYIARHIKNRSLLKNISVVKLAMYLIKKRKERIAETERRGAEYTDFRKRILRVLIPAVSVIDVILLILLLFLSDLNGAFILLVFPVGIAQYFLIRWFMRYITAVRDIFASLHKMRMGENLSELEKEKMPLSLRAYAEDINCVSDGLSIAVKNATREQRTKTELITNVSHDLKTPLTSIINYVDLLSKRDIEDEEAKKYIGVLSEKSEKLKKLIDDLVEASKASAGNIAVNFVKMSLSELTAQMVGEYEEDFSGKNLTVVIQEPEGDIQVCADSKLSCRVLDNLMVNIKKYAMPGTRVYIKTYRDGSYGCVEMSNISENPLNISAEELKERFVRGDESRNTEGSGLGLSIAEDFMRVQSGRLDLVINGDMFTAKVRFPK